MTVDKKKLLLTTNKCQRPNNNQNNRKNLTKKRQWLYSGYDEKKHHGTFFFLFVISLSRILHHFFSQVIIRNNKGKNRQGPYCKQNKIWLLLLNIRFESHHQNKTSKGCVVFMSKFCFSFFEFHSFLRCQMLIVDFDDYHVITNIIVVVVKMYTIFMSKRNTHTKM